MEALVSQGLDPFYVQTEDGWQWAHHNVKEFPSDLLELGAGVGHRWCLEQFAVKAQRIDPMAYIHAMNDDHVVVDRETALSKDARAITAILEARTGAHEGGE